MNYNKNIFYEQQIFAIKIADIYNPDVKNNLMKMSDMKNTIFPSPNLIYQNSIVIENEKYLNIYKNKKSLKINCSNIKGVKNNEIKEKNNIIKKIFYEDSKDKKSHSENKQNNNVKNTRNNNNLRLKMESITNSKDEITCTSTSDEKDKINMIFQNNDKSRFDFVNNDKKGNNEVPHFISKINNLAFKINILLSQSNTIGKENNFLYIDELNDIKNENDKKWKKFLVDNLKE